jgi:hypothetical protein
MNCFPGPPQTSAAPQHADTSPQQHQFAVRQAMEWALTIPEPMVVTLQSILPQRRDRNRERETGKCLTLLEQFVTGG